MPRPQSDKYLTFQITLTPTARAYTESLRDRTGIPATEAMARLLEWFSAMPHGFQTALLSRDLASRDQFLLQWAREQLAAGDIRPDQLLTDDADKLLANVITYARALHLKEATQRRRADALGKIKRKPT